MKEEMHRPEERVHRHQAEEPEVVRSRKQQICAARDVVTEHRARAEEDEPRYAEQYGAPMRLLARRDGSREVCST
jgi:hypothetical protein